MEKGKEGERKVKWKQGRKISPSSSLRSSPSQSLAMVSSRALSSVFLIFLSNHNSKSLKHGWSMECGDFFIITRVRSRSSYCLVSHDPPQYLSHAILWIFSRSVKDDPLNSSKLGTQACSSLYIFSWWSCDHQILELCSHFPISRIYPKFSHE